MRDKLAAYTTLDAVARVIARNLSLNLLRAKSRAPLPVENLPVENLPNNFTDNSDDFSREIADEILPLIAKLPDMEQAVLRLKHLEGMETTEIAALINSSPGAVRTALSRARSHIRTLFFKNN